MRKLDALVAKTLGYIASQWPVWKKTYETEDDWVQTTPDRTLRCSLPNYSTDIKAAWELLEESHKLGFVWVIEQADTSDIATVHIIDPKNKHADTMIHFIEEMEKISEKAKSVPMAICLAFLKAKGVSEKEIEEAMK